MHIIEKKPDGIAYFWTLTNFTLHFHFFYVWIHKQTNRSCANIARKKTQCLRSEKNLPSTIYVVLLPTHWHFHSPHSWFSLKICCGWLIKALKCTAHGNEGEMFASCCMRKSYHSTGNNNRLYLRFTQRQKRIMCNRQTDTLAAYWIHQTAR